MPSPDIYLNRELSWLAYSERILAQAAPERTPPMTRLRFLSIFTHNLDEFFMVRVGGLNDQFLLGDNLTDDKTGLLPSEQMTLALSGARRLYKRRDASFTRVTESLGKEGLVRLTVPALSKKQKNLAQNYFRERILPVLSPLVIDSRHRFPFLENRVKYLMVRLRANKVKKTFGIVRLGDTADGILTFENAPNRFLLCEDLLLSMAGDVFKGYDIERAVILRATRSAECEPEAGEKNEDARRKMRRLLKQRERLAPVRLELYKKQDDHMLAFLLKHTAIVKNQVFFSKSPLDHAFLPFLEASLPAGRRAALLTPPCRPAWPEGLVKGQALLPQIQAGDVLLIHPHDSMEPLLELLREAGRYDHVVSIHMSLYRLCDSSQVIAALCRAAENGKRVTVALELRARFDERSNIDWAAALEESGCQVIYGPEGYKVHAKALLITIHDGNGERYVSHLGTGNYNEQTARQYVDAGLLTAHDGIGRDVKTFFDDLAAAGTDISRLAGQYEYLLTSPVGLRPALIGLIDGEIQKAPRGEKTGILLKMNGLTDKRLIDKLLEASRAGVPVRLLVRGLCCLRPGVPGLSENVEVMSLVGRFLQHARVFCFGGGESRTVYLSSADGMTRNMERRVELAVPVLDRALAGRLYGFLREQLADTEEGWRLEADGSYGRIEN